MVRVSTLIILLTCVVLSEAQPAKGYCSFYDECGMNPLVHGPRIVPPVVPCLNYSQARHVTGDHYKKLKEVCPMLDRGEGNTFACCSPSQLTSLQRDFALASLLLRLCPACIENFVHFHCSYTCSPDQSQFVEVTRVMNVTASGMTREAVVSFRTYFDKSFAGGVFDSCQNVQTHWEGKYAIDSMCGPKGRYRCTSQRWYDFQGNSHAFAPLDIQHKLMTEGDVAGVPEGVVPYKETALRCNETTPSGAEACSCDHCWESCPDYDDYDD
ncbi:unnamed protein product [Ophioblennius macclurei]